MAHQPAIRPDPSSFDPTDEPRNDLPRSELDDQDPSLVLAELARTLAQHGGGSSSADLALDLVLNEIVQQACLATTATGAAAGLIHEGELVVRATTGVNAPELGVRLSVQAGLSGACVQTGRIQLCEDAQGDPRVDPETCAELNIQSILAVPIVTADEVLGILEIFSNRSHAFGDRDQQTLQALARRIVNTLRGPEQSAQGSTHDLESVSVPDSFAAEPEPPSQPENVAEQQPLPKRLKRDYSTVLLTLLIFLALLLGWMFGRPRWQASEPETSSTRPTAEPVQSGQPSETIPAESSRLNDTKSVQKKAKPVEPQAASGLVVYEKGKVIFESSQQARPAAGSTIPRISSAIAGGLVTSKVSPDYPESAKQQHIEGPVHLDITVGEDGFVQNVQVTSGDRLLANAAVAAVRQWRFRPYEPGGTAKAFRTSVAVKFTLSGSDNEAKNP